MHLTAHDQQEESWCRGWESSAPRSLKIASHWRPHRAKRGMPGSWDRRPGRVPSQCLPAFGAVRDIPHERCPTRLQYGIHPSLKAVLRPAQQRLVGLQHADCQGVAVEQLQRRGTRGTAGRWGGGRRCGVAFWHALSGRVESCQNGRAVALRCAPLCSRLQVQRCVPWQTEVPGPAGPASAGPASAGPTSAGPARPAPRPRAPSIPEGTDASDAQRPGELRDTRLEALQPRVVLPRLCQRQQRCYEVGPRCDAAQHSHTLRQQGRRIQQVGQPAGNTGGADGYE